MSKQGRAGGDRDDSAVYRIPPHHYLHVIDLNSNITRVELGPKTYIRQDNERVLLGPEQMVVVPPRHYCVVENPVVIDKDGKPVLDKFGQARLQHADLEVRLARDPFPLYPGERLKQVVTPLTVVTANKALRLRAVLDFESADGTKRVAGDEWLFEGPGTYYPRKEVVVEETITAVIVKNNQAIRLRAKKEAKDRDGNDRVTGEEWLVKKTGAYLPGAHEEVVDIVQAYILTEKRALHVRAVRTFTDDFGILRKNGEEWLITFNDTETHIPHVYEAVVGEVNITTLSNRQYCVIVDPIGNDGKPQLGKKRLVKGEKSFFLRPGEKLEAGIQNVFILGENEGLILRANESFSDATAGKTRQPGDRWMIRGPIEYVPPVEVEVAARRTAIPLDENEGIYVRDIKSGKVRAVIGHTYMLNEDECLWHKLLPQAIENMLSDRAPYSSEARLPFTYSQSIAEERTITQCTNIIDMHYDSVQQQVRAVNGETYMLSQDEELWEKSMLPAVEDLLTQERDPYADRSNRQGGLQRQTRDKTRVVTFRVPHNAAVQIYDYKNKKARVVFGPEQVMLNPDEQFTQLSLSGGKPKKPNVIKALCLLLGPDFFTDIVTVETADHARLQLQLAYNWHFDLGNKESDSYKLFSVADFVGDACKAIASRIRGSVAAVPFDDFHKNSAKIIRSSVFGLDEHMKVRNLFKFEQNGLVITSIDIQSVEPVDQRTRDSLQKSVQLAIEITTNSQEAAARHEAERLEQEAKGRLERQKIVDEADAEKARKSLLELQSLSAAVESTGQAKAEAQSRAEAAKIEGEAAVQQAKLKAEATAIDAESELTRLQQAREAEIKYLREQNQLEVDKARELSEIDVQKFKDMVSAIGADTIRAMAVAGPEMQVRLLQGLGLKSTLITDGTSPINLFNTAHGLLGALPTSERPSKRAKKEEDSDSE